MAESRDQNCWASSLHKLTQVTGNRLLAGIEGQLVYLILAMGLQLEETVYLKSLSLWAPAPMKFLGLRSTLSRRVGPKPQEFGLSNFSIHGVVGLKIFCASY